MSNKLLLVGYIVVLIIMPIQDVGVAHVIGKMIESLRTGKGNTRSYVTVLIAMICVVQVGHAINDLIEIKIFPTFQKFICNKILQYILNMSSQNLQEILNGKVLTIMSHCPRTMYNYLDVWRTNVIPQLVIFAVVFVYIFLRNKKLGLIVLASSLVYYFCAFGTIIKCSDPSQDREKYLIEVNEQVDDVLGNVVGILNANQKEKELDRLNVLYDNYQKYGAVALKCTMKFKFLLMLIMPGLLVTFLVVGYTSVRAKKLKLESCIVCIIIYLYMFNSITKTIDEVRDTAIRGGMVKEQLKVFDSMAAAPTNSTPSNGQAFQDKYIYFDKVSFSYDGKQVLKDFSLEIHRGEKLLIIGQIGSGKTTLLKMLMRYANPGAGHIYYQGTPFEKISREEIRKKVGYIPQNPVLLNRTLYENIVYGSPAVSKEQVMDLINTLELGNIFNESRLDQKVGKHGSKLSGGQRQVVWILRVLVQNPEVLIMDEPTSAIDKDTKTFIDRLFAKVMDKRTVIIVSHDEYMSKLVDRTIKIPS